MAGFGNFQGDVPSQLGIRLVKLSLGLLKEFEPFRKKFQDWGHWAASLWDFVTISYSHKNTLPL
jgi:hypothetical protein